MDGCSISVKGSWNIHIVRPAGRPVKVKTQAHACRLTETEDASNRGMIIHKTTSDDEPTGTSYQLEAQSSGNQNMQKGIDSPSLLGFHVCTQIK